MKCLDCQTEYHHNGCIVKGCTMSIITGSSYADHVMCHWLAGRWSPFTCDYMPETFNPLYRQTIDKFNPWEAPQNTCPRCYHRGYPEYVGTKLVDNVLDAYIYVYGAIEYINTRCLEIDRLPVHEIGTKLNTLIDAELPNHTFRNLYRISVVYVPSMRSVSAHVGYDDMHGNYKWFDVYIHDV